MAEKVQVDLVRETFGEEITEKMTDRPVREGVDPPVINKGMDEDKALGRLSPIPDKRPIPSMSVLDRSSVSQLHLGVAMSRPSEKFLMPANQLDMLR